MSIDQKYRFAQVKFNSECRASRAPITFGIGAESVSEYACEKERSGREGAFRWAEAFQKALDANVTVHILEKAKPAEIDRPQPRHGTESHVLHDFHVAGRSIDLEELQEALSNEWREFQPLLGTPDVEIQKLEAEWSDRLSSNVAGYQE
jgi:hypothetical protein